MVSAILQVIGAIVAAYLILVIASIGLFFLLLWGIIKLAEGK